MPDAIDPATWEDPALRRALAARDIAAVFRALTATGVPQRRIAELTGMGQSEVSEVLARRRVMAYDVLARIADGLGVPRGLMGLAYDEETARTYAGNGPSAGEELTEDMKRRHFLAAASVALWGRPVLGELLELPAPPETPTPLPSRLGAADVEALRALTEQVRALARFYGGQADTIGAIANRSMRLMSVDADESVKKALGSALSELHCLAGWSSYDTHLDDNARYHYRQAVDLAAETGDSLKLVSALQHAAIMGRERDAPNDALKLYQLARVRLTDMRGEDARAAARDAWLHVQAASALVLLDRPGEAAEELARANPEHLRDPFERADMDHLRALVHMGLNEMDAAESCAASSVQTWGEKDRRDGVLAEITLAQLHVQAGERGGAELARRAIAKVAELHSGRARDRLEPLERALAARRDATARDLARHAAAVRSTA